MSTSNLRALLEDGVSIQPGVVTDSEVSALSRVGCGNDDGKLYGGTPLGAPA